MHLRMQKESEVFFMAKLDISQMNGQDVRDKTTSAVKSTVSTVQDTVSSGLSKAQDVLQSALGTTQDYVQSGQKQATKNLKKARKQAKKGLSSAQDTAQSSLARTQDVLLAGMGLAQALMEQQSKRASKGLKKAQKNLQSVGDSLQSRAARSSRHRKRGKFLFRVGLLTGLVMALLFTPWPGVEFRSHLVGLWQSMFSQQSQQ